MTKDFDAYLNVDWTEHFIDLDTGIRMAYCECGDAEGTPLLLLHGVTDGRVSWAQVAPALAEMGYHCYIIEYRGNGKTDKPDQGECGYTAELLADDVLDFMDKKGLDKIHIAGHSYGSLIAQTLALKAPDRFSSYVLIDSAVSCLENEVVKWVLDGDEEGFGGVYAYKDRMPEDFVKEWTATPNEDEGFRTATFLHAYQLPAAAWRNLMDGLKQFDNTDGIRRIKGDVLVMWGTEDEIFTAEDQRQLKEGLVSCNVQYVDIEGAGHNGFWDSKARAKEYAGHMDAFLKGVNVQ